MTLLDLLLLLLVAGICGSLGRAISGYSHGGCLVSIALGFIGAVLGMWLARKLGLPELFAVQIGTTSYAYVTKNIKPSKQPSVYNTSSDVNSGLKAHQIDGIVVDLPTAFYITAVQIPQATIVGQFPTVGTPEHFGMVLAKGNNLTSCVDKALASLKSAGTLAKIQQEWLSNKASAPVLK